MSRQDKERRTRMISTLGPPLESLARIVHSLPAMAASTLNPWREVTGLLAREFGPTWVEVELGVISAGIHSRKERGTGADRLFDSESPLPDRVRQARRRAKQPVWWHDQLNDIESQLDQCLWILACLTWAETTTVYDLFPFLDAQIASLPATLQYNLIQALGRSTKYSSKAKVALGQEESENVVAHAASVTCAMLMGRFSSGSRLRVLTGFVLPAVSSPAIASMCLAELVKTHEKGLIGTPEALDLAATCQELGAESNGFFFAPRRNNSSLGRDWVDLVMDRQDELPDCYVLSAYAMRKQDASQAASVMDISIRQEWFK